MAEFATGGVKAIRPADFLRVRLRWGCTARSCLLLPADTGKCQNYEVKRLSTPDLSMSATHQFREFLLSAPIRRLRNTEQSKVDVWLSRRSQLLSLRDEMRRFGIWSVHDGTMDESSLGFSEFDSRVVVAVGYLEPNPLQDQVVEGLRGRPANFSVGGQPRPGGPRLAAVLNGAESLRTSVSTCEQKMRVDEWYESQELLLRAHEDGARFEDGTEVSAAAIDVTILACVEAEAGTSWLSAVLKHHYEIEGGKLVAVFQGLFRERKRNVVSFDASLDLVKKNLQHVLGPFVQDSAALDKALANGIDVCEQGKGAHDGAVATTKTIVAGLPEAGKLKARLISTAYSALPRNIVRASEQMGGNLMSENFLAQKVLTLLT